MKEMMQKLNVVKYATSEEQKEALMKKGFVPVKSVSVPSDTEQNQGKGSQPEPDQKSQKKSGQKSQQKSGQKTKPKSNEKSQQKPVSESGQGAEGTSNPETQTAAVQAGDGNA